jgi:ATP-binding cassette, subfamily C, bacterial
MIALTLAFSQDLWDRLGWRLGGLLLWLIVSAVLGALSTAAMLPLLEAAGIGSGQVGAAGAAVAGAMFSVQHAFGLPAGTTGYAIVLVVLLVANYASFWMHAWASARLQASYVATWQVDLFKAFLGARWSFFQRHRQGDLVNALNGEMLRLNGAFYQGSALLAALVHIGVYVAAALLVSWQVTLAILVTGGALVALSLPLMRRGARLGYRISDDYAGLQSAAGQFLAQAKLVKATATESSAETVFAAIAHRVQGLNAKVTIDSATVRAALEFVSALLVIGILLGGAWIGIGAAEILVVMGLFVRIFPRLSSLQQSGQALASVIASLVTVHRLHATALSEREQAGIGALPFATDEPVNIELAGLTVTAGGRVILDNVDLKVRPGELLALVGPSGAGKSTLVDCLLGLVEPSSGMVRVAGNRLADLPLASWRRAIGYVAQDAAILDATVAENLTWGNAGAGRSDLERAVAQAAAQAVIASMPEGYDTLLGPKGRALSGGERQRIGLARSLVGGRVLLIFDEATSAQDAETEAGIIETIRSYKGRMTMIMIAHRLTSVRVADRICVLDKGRIVETGSFAELTAKPTRFRELWEAQGGEQQSSLAGPAQA